MTTIVEELVESDTEDRYAGPDDHDRFSHYTPKAEIARAAIEGTPARAICGKRWVPTRDGQRFPICPECKDLYDAPWRRDA